jgi:hypothetical protein
LNILFFVIKTWIWPAHAPYAIGPVQASPVKFTLNLRVGEEVIDFCSSSSYDLSGFSSGAGPEVVYVESSSSSIGNDWFDASVVPHGFPDKGVVMTIDRSQLDDVSRRVLGRVWLVTVVCHN